MRREAEKTSQTGRGEVGQESSGVWLKGWEVNLAAFSPRFANVSSKDPTALSSTPTFEIPKAQQLFLFRPAAFKFPHLPRRTSSPTKAHWPETKLSPRRELPALKHSSVCFLWCCEWRVMSWMKREPSWPVGQRRRESSGTGRRVETEPCSCLSSKRMIQKADATFSRAVMWAVHANVDDNSRGCYFLLGRPLTCCIMTLRRCCQKTKTRN